MKRLKTITCLFAVGIFWFPWQKGYAEIPQEKTDSVVLKMSIKTLNLSGKNVTDMDMRDCRSLEELDLSANPLLEQLDISETKITRLNIQGCGMTSFKALHCRELEYLDCRENRLTKLDIEGSTSSIRELYAERNAMCLSTIYAILLARPENALYYFSPQEVDSKTLDVGEEWDLTTELIIGGNLSDYTLYDTTGEVIPKENYTLQNGVLSMRYSGVYRLELKNRAVIDYTEENGGDPVICNYRMKVNFKQYTANENSDKEEFRVFAKDRIIYLSGAIGEVRVFTMTGQLIYSGYDMAIPVNAPGMYLVRIGSIGQKVMVF